MTKEIEYFSPCIFENTCKFWGKFGIDGDGYVFAEKFQNLPYKGESENLLFLRRTFLCFSCKNFHGSNNLREK